MNVEQAYEDIGIILESAGNNWKASCPFHIEKTPSFVVYPDGSFYCFGCQVGGTYEICRKKLGFDNTPKEFFVAKRLEDIEENPLLDLEEKKFELEEKLFAFLDGKEYNIKKKAWNLFDSLWLDFNFLPNNVGVLDQVLFLKRRFKEIEEIIKHGAKI